MLHWTEDGAPRQATWRSERGAPAPTRLLLTDDRMTADAAFRHANEGTGLLWRGDFHNARQLLQALARRTDKAPTRGRRSRRPEPVTPVEAFHRHRQAQAQRARVLASVLIGVAADHSIGLRRAPDLRAACDHAWGPPTDDGEPTVLSLRELLGVASAYQWYVKGVSVPALGERIHPGYGVFSPLRGEYIDLVAQAPLPAAAADLRAFDIGTGSGVLAAVLARRGISGVVATEREPRAIANARENLIRLGLDEIVEVQPVDLFPDGQADLIVCNPPWLPARPGAPIERAVYDEDGQMLAGFLAGLAAHLRPGGEGWLILSDLAEHLGLRQRSDLMSAFEQGGLRVLGRDDARPRHAKASDVEDPLHAARAAELTSLWRLGLRA